MFWSTAFVLVGVANGFVAGKRFEKTQYGGVIFASLCSIGSFIMAAAYVVSA